MMVTARLPCARLAEGELIGRTAQAVGTRMNPNVLRAYLDAGYRADLPGGRIALTVGVEPALPAGLAAGAGCALITAWNPGSIVTPRAANDAAHARLRDRLAGLAASVFPGAGESRDGAWYEPGWFALGLAPGMAIVLGHEFGQSAILAAGPGEPLWLVVLAPDRCETPGMDTRFVRWLASPR
jgi:hypothetical protein